MSDRMTLTIEVKMMPRLDCHVTMKELGFKKGWKPAMFQRRTPDDHLTPWRIKSQEMLSYNANVYWNQVINKLRDTLPYNLNISPEFGDMLIGYVEMIEFDDFYCNIYKPVKRLTK